MEDSRSYFLRSRSIFLPSFCAFYRYVRIFEHIYFVVPCSFTRAKKKITINTHTQFVRWNLVANVKEFMDAFPTKKGRMFNQEYFVIDIISSAYNGCYHFEALYYCFLAYNTVFSVPDTLSFFHILQVYKWCVVMNLIKVCSTVAGHHTKCRLLYISDNLSDWRWF